MKKKAATKETTKPVVAKTAQLQEVRMVIKPPNFGRALFELEGLTQLCIHRFSQKVLDGLRGLPDPKTGEKAPSKSRKGGKKKYPDEVLYNDARYTSPEGWDGFQASAIRNALISACRVAGFKMTVAKLSLFCEADGYDKTQPQFGLCRIYGDPRMAIDMGRVATGEPYPIVRPVYFPWKAKITLRWDADQFHMEDVANLLTRVGLQVGIGEGRWDSKKSAGQGWGQFTLGDAREILKK